MNMEGFCPEILKPGITFSKPPPQPVLLKNTPAGYLLLSIIFAYATGGFF